MIDSPEIRALVNRLRLINDKIRVLKVDVRALLADRASLKKELAQKRAEWEPIERERLQDLGARQRVRRTRDD